MPSDDHPESGQDPAQDAAARTAGDGDAYRVLIVEDDRSQALFAQTVLHGAGLVARIVDDPAEVLAAMRDFRPDLVLMDLHLPQASGTQLTRAIRDDPGIAHTPIVFLTGDADPETHFDALESGADDFLTKPVRPRHLIAVVQTRVKRARALLRQRPQADVRHAATGLYHRPHLLGQVAASLERGAEGGLLLVEIQQAQALRERLGYAGFETLITLAGQQVARLAQDAPAARLNDHSFLVVVAQGDAADEAGLRARARELRDGLGQTPLDIDGMPMRLRVAVGHLSLAQVGGAVGEALDAAEQAVRLARNDPSGIAAFRPPAGVAPDSGAVSALRDALAKGELELAFQPIVAVAGGDEAQFQVLLRWRGADGRVRSAGDFLPLAEASGLMPDIDRWVLDATVQRLQLRKRQHRPVRLFVSQSPRTIAASDHAAWLADLLRAHEIESRALVVDLSLADAQVHGLILRQFCDALTPAGVQFCLSRYVHGDEADALLDQLPLAYLRLSPIYSQAETRQELRDDLRMAIDRAHRLGLQVIGPQVEDPRGAAMLWMSGIDLIQGNLVQMAAGELDFDFQHAVL